ncbi:hypothetical protein HK100_011211 [Physocladia obscura]|uniref:G protein-coupled receptor n=1 Tax=Physocladia obscura TaxID=109957 RepID=A0AAD5T273_9FUNG|nr:hypothetical protein HK100_011211 [Physocladia obscura]
MSTLAPAVLAALDAALNPAQQAELSSLSTAQITALLTAPPRFMSEAQLLSALLYFYATGVILNGAILFTVAFDPKRLLRTNLDRLTVALISVCFVWSTGRAIVHSLQGLSVIDLTNPSAAAFSYVCMLFLFALNAHIAMERYFQIRENPLSKRIYALIWSIVLAILAVGVWLFTSSPISDGIKPDNHLQQTVWLTCISIGYIGTSCIMAWFYSRTYHYSTRQFDENPDLAAFFMKERDGRGDDPEVLRIVRMRVERQILTKCFALSLALMMLYAPFYAYEIQSYIVGAIPFFDLSGTYMSISFLLLSSDVLVTPILVFAFKKEIREAIMFWK